MDPINATDTPATPTPDAPTSTPIQVVIQEPDQTAPDTSKEDKPDPTKPLALSSTMPGTCPVCMWPMAKNGCTSEMCMYTPESAIDQYKVNARRQELGAANLLPTKEQEIYNSFTTPTTGTVAE